MTLFRRHKFLVHIQCCHQECQSQEKKFTFQFFVNKINIFYIKVTASICVHTLGCLLFCYLYFLSYLFFVTFCHVNKILLLKKRRRKYDLKIEYNLYYFSDSGSASHYFDYLFICLYLIVKLCISNFQQNDEFAKNKKNHVNFKLRDPVTVKE